MPSVSQRASWHAYTGVGAAEEDPRLFEVVSSRMSKDPPMPSASSSCSVPKSAGFRPWLGGFGGNALLSRRESWWRGGPASGVSCEEKLFHPPLARGEFSGDGKKAASGRRSAEGDHQDRQPAGDPQANPNLSVSDPSVETNIAASSPDKDAGTTEVKRTLTHRLKQFVSDRFDGQLSPTDFAKIGGIFVGAKYATLVVFLAIGIRYRPILSFIQRQKTQDMLARRGKNIGFDHTQLSRWLRQTRQELSDSKSIREVRDRYRVARERLKKRLHRQRARWSEHVQSKVEEEAGGLNQARTEASAGAGGNWTRVQWVMDKYYELAMKLSRQAEKSWTLKKLAEVCHNDPKIFALGFAEGTLLYKMTFPITAPIEFWLICKGYLRWKRTDSVAGEGS